jgi:hypothetical protein
MRSNNDMRLKSRRHALLSLAPAAALALSLGGCVYPAPPPVAYAPPPSGGYAYAPDAGYAPYYDPYYAYSPYYYGPGYYPPVYGSVGLFFGGGGGGHRHFR